MSGARVCEAGDSALLLELEPVIDAGVNARAIAAAGALTQRALAGVRDVRSTYRSVAVYFDPLACPLPALREALDEAIATAPRAVEGSAIDVPVCYGGDDGPDLDDVARWTGLSPDAVIARHLEQTYRVFMLGFLPGFPYMGRVDDSIAAPRRPAPRLRVRAGSVGLAGTQTGIYPFDAPGGWQIIGRTPLQVFDAARPAPARLAPGDHVRFVREHSMPPAPAPPAPVPAAGVPPGPHIRILHPGLLTTVQDAGRWGHQHLGVPVCGAMDPAALRCANVLAGNAAGAAALEVTAMGPEIRIEAVTSVAVAGADLGATLDGAPLDPNTVAIARAGSVLRFATRRTGGRAYVAFGGGVDVPVLFGSRSTHTRTAMGGFEGRALRGGDGIPLGAWNGERRASCGGVRRVPSGGARLRVMPGPQDDFFPPQAIGVLASTRFTITTASDRMGYRLAGDRVVPRVRGREMISDATFTGAIQVPPSGEPILLMADRQTTGGYPQIAVVITADLPVAGQLLPGDWVEFEVCTRGEAVAALRDADSETSVRG